MENLSSSWCTYTLRSLIDFTPPLDQQRQAVMMVDDLNPVVVICVACKVFDKMPLWGSFVFQVASTRLSSESERAAGDPLDLKVIGASLTDQPHGFQLPSWEGDGF
ncbi:hypothetical protein L6452_06565 [Arctium lappa]|uniref:Uncharacterized protein n=1 Tax=Arctium lappa TaxID=4217 RepID=A0ACB9EJH8_ARCLA|nr:hypothetical protein L6452_06565 [Arctium lappa]